MSEHSPTADHMPNRPAFSKHRLEGLTDGIYAVAMTLLAIELRFPESAQIGNDGDLVVQLAHLLPHFISWALSFAILGIFWHARTSPRGRSWLRIICHALSSRVRRSAAGGSSPARCCPSASAGFIRATHRCHTWR